MLRCGTCNTFNKFTSLGCFYCSDSNGFSCMLITCAARDWFDEYVRVESIYPFVLGPFARYS